MIGMGEQVLPLIFERLAKGPDHWYSALTAITEVDPAQGVETMEEARQAWLQWARDNGHLRDSVAAAAVE